nr:uncharacterized protein LOC123767495 [Procambarus clarkii]
MVSGDSPDMEFFIMTTEDYHESMALLHSEYVGRNPLCKACGETGQNTYTEPLMSDVRKCLASGASIGVRDKASKTLAGVFLNAPLNMDEACASSNINTDNLGIEYRVLRRLTADTRLLFQDQEVHQVLDLFVLCVHRGYGGRRLASTLLQKSLRLGAEQGYEMASVLSTNSVTEKICARLGFQTVKSLDLTTLAEEFSIDTSLIPGETEMKMMTKRLPPPPPPCNNFTLSRST